MKTKQFLYRDVLMNYLNSCFIFQLDAKELDTGFDIFAFRGDSSENRQSPGQPGLYKKILELKIKNASK